MQHPLMSLRSKRESDMLGHDIKRDMLGQNQNLMPARGDVLWWNVYKSINKWVFI